MKVNPETLTATEARMISSYNRNPDLMTLLNSLAAKLSDDGEEKEIKIRYSLNDSSLMELKQRGFEVTTHPIGEFKHTISWLLAGV